jgi:uncharacterized membrane protein
MMQLSNDLRLPRFSMTHGEAVARRLRRNYIWLFLIILLAWVLKTTTSVLQPGQVRVHVVHSAGELFQNAAIGYIPGWLVLLSVLVFYGWLFYVILSNRKMTGELAYGEVHV